LGFDVGFLCSDTDLDSEPDDDARFVVGFSRELQATLPVRSAGGLCGGSSPKESGYE